MRRFFLLLTPRLLALRHSLRRTDARTRRRTWIMLGVGLLFWGGMFLLSSRVLSYFQSVEVIGDILSRYLLGMVLLIFFSLLVFSHIITSLSALFLSEDLELCHATPASLEEVFLSRVACTIMDGSWMMVIFGLPVMLAYAWVYQAGPGFYAALAFSGLPLILIAAGVAVLLTMILVNVFPAQRTRDIMTLLTVLLVVGLYFMFRFLRPERLVDPDAFFSTLQYISALKAPDSPYLPTYWASEIIWRHLSGTTYTGYLLHFLLLWSTGAALMVINVWTAQALYFKGFSRAREAKKRRTGGGVFLGILNRIFRLPLARGQAAVVDKDIRAFFRDNSQWSQLILLTALTVVYLYNFSVLPLERSAIRLDFLQNQIAFLNLGLAGFVVSAVSVRFVFPAVSAEGRAFWIIQSSPLSLRRFLWGKFALYIIPMLVLGETLIIFTNRLLQVSGLMMVLLSITMFMTVFGIVAMGVGLGAVYPDFRHENIARVATGFGGLVYMIVCALFMALVILLEAGPVYLIFMAGVRGEGLSLLQWTITAAAFAMVIALNIIAVVTPMRMGVTALSNYE